MDPNITKSEVDDTKTPSHEQEVGCADSVMDVAVENSTDITSVVSDEESRSTEMTKENCSSACKTSDCNGDLEGRNSLETISDRPQAEDNARTEVPMDLAADENQVDIVIHSPKSPSEQSPSELSSSTPNKATETSSMVSAESPSDCPVEVKISDDEDDIVELPHGSEHTFLGMHRGTVVPYPESDSDSDSSSSSDSETTSDSSSSECEDEVSKSVTRNNKSSSDSKSSDPKPIKVRGELDIEDLPPIQDLHISVRNDQVVEIGKVLHAVDTLVVVECYKDQPPLDIDSVLFLDRGARPLGRIFDVMGPVTEPLYCVRFNSKEHIEEQNIQPEMLVYSAPQTEHSQFVFLKHLMMMKGSDASWRKDKEVPGSELDFSDDEVEAQIRRESNNRTENSPNSWDGPKRKVARPNQNASDDNFQSNVHGFHGGPRGQTRENYRPRNPWGWSGARFNVPNNNAPPNHQNQFNRRGFVRSPSFNAQSSSQIRAPHRNVANNQQPSNTQFGLESSPGMPPPSYGSSSEYSYQHQGNDYTQENGYTSGNNYSHGHDYSNGSEYLHGHDYSNGNAYTHGQEAYPPHNTPDPRYQAFQSEIAKLVDAYNRGVDSPMSVASATYGMRPPGPPGLFPSSPQFGARPPGPRPQFGVRPFGTRPPFGGRPPSVPHQFATPPPGPRPQFGSRPPGPPPPFGSRPAGPPPPFGSRVPAPSYNNNQFY